MWYLKHFSKDLIITCKSHHHAITEFYYQERLDDGVIPWTIMYMPLEQFKAKHYG